MTNYDYLAEFRTYTNSEVAVLVDVFISFNIDEDDCEVHEFDRLVFKKCYAIEMGHITARETASGKDYRPTEDDLMEWNYDIKAALKKEFNRQLA